LSANDYGVVSPPAIIAHSSPLSIVAELHSPFGRRFSVSQPNISVSAHPYTHVK